MSTAGESPINSVSLADTAVLVGTDGGVVHALQR